jgi:type VI secretion system protein VasI
MTNSFAARLRQIATLDPCSQIFAALGVGVLSMAAPAAWADWAPQANASEGAVVIAASSETPVDGLFGRATPAEMTVRCIENNTSITFSFGETFLSDLTPYGDVTLQIDATEEQIVALEKGDDDQTLVWASGRHAVPFLIQAMSGRTLTVGVTTFSDDRLAAQFSLGGLTAALGPVRSACNW